MQDVFCSRLKSARKKTGITQVRLSEMTEIDQGKISRLETGSQEPNIAQLRSLAVALSVSVDWLIGLTDSTSGDVGSADSAACPAIGGVQDALNGLTDEQIGIVLAFIAGLKA